MTDDNPFKKDEEIPPEYVFDNLHWCRKEIGYAKTEVDYNPPKRRLDEVFDRLKDIEDTLAEYEEFRSEVDRDE